MIPILSEEQVIEAVSRYLVMLGYEEVSRALATQQGVDLIVIKEGRELHIEAKGAGSSRSGSNRYGQEFNASQVFDHVGKAVLKALEVVATRRYRAGIALPANRLHMSQIDQIRPVLDQLQIAVFLVDPSGAVVSAKGL